jgi:hypothetical protein
MSEIGNELWRLNEAARREEEGSRHVTGPDGLRTYPARERVTVGTFIDRSIRRWVVSKDGKPLAWLYSRQEAEELAAVERARLADPQAAVLDRALDED